MAPEAQPNGGPTPVVAGRDTIVTVISTMESTPTAATSSAAVKSKSNIGPIVGGLVGGIAAGLVLIGLIIWLFRWRKNKKESEKQILEKRRKRLEQKYRVTQHSTTSSLSSNARLNSVAVSEKSFDPSVPVTPPVRLLTTHESPKAIDPFQNEHGYGQAMQYVVPAAGNNMVQQPYDQQPTVVYVPIVLNNEQPPAAVSYTPPSPPASDSDSGSSSSGSSGGPQSQPSSSGSSRRSSTRGAARAAASELAVASASAPLSSRHRPLRPSPLANSSEHMRNSAFNGGSPDPSLSVSPASSSSDGCSPFSSSPGTMSPPSSDSHAAAYAAAAGGAWAMPHGQDKMEAHMDFTKPKGVDASPELDGDDVRTLSGVYSYDPFAEYHSYEAMIDGREDLAPETTYAVEPGHAV
ncbi:uncharacterized protein EHS24_008567 [Apiotrichum porosum]|uniref:Uncharacterized protein n=1 Tax=Apiotrichum porosum TaxID=105984 RepID=A0A427XQP4_9TREE|nr:uncharacterized protein EHS24_008567 [Apiotrichum porosum]RSH81133.1 hypothetical protein EHS24_008567 [Apiotrichum porosum]